MSEFEIIEQDPGDSKQNKDKYRKVLDGFLALVEPLIISGLLAIFAWLFIATPHEVDGSSMEPNFHDTSFVVALKLAYKFKTPQRGDVIIFKRSETRDFIKRVIGLPGETISIKECGVYINGTKLDESDYLASDVCTYTGIFQYLLDDGQEYIIPEDSYIVLGDNRQGSTDSRDFGAIEISRIKGRAFFVISSGEGKKMFIVPREEY